MSELIRLLVVDDHTVVRKGLCSLLTSKYGIEVVGEAEDGLEAVEKARETHPDVILMDMVMPKMTGLEAIIEIRKEDPDARILVLTSFGDDAQITAAIKAGALGYLLKDSSPDELIHTIRSVYMGTFSVPAEMLQALLSESQDEDEKIPAEHDLTERELDVLRELARGSSNQDIADTLFISTTTVRSHVRSIFQKLNLSNRTQAALYALESGLVTRDQQDPG